MSGLFRTLLVPIGRRAVFYALVLLAALTALWTAARHGRQAAEVALALRQADARIRIMKRAKDIRHDTQSIGRSDLDRRADRWMRD